jgi:small subunit ribosomal protein S4
MLKGDRCATAKCALVKKNYPPGIHGPKGRGRPTGYSLQLREKQKAKRIYNILEKQFKITYDHASNMKGDLGDNLLSLLENRLDNTIYRLGLAVSRSQARELVSHGHFTVNKKRVYIPSYQLKIGDIIKIKDSSQKSKNFINLAEKLKKISLPSWLNFNIQAMEAKVLSHPKKEDLEAKINVQLIIEFYSK